MNAGFAKFGLTLTVVALLAGCSDEPRLLNLGASTRTPDEFGIVPSKPLSAPADYSSLPTPTPGGSNLTDQTPNGDAVAAMGGNPAVLTRAGIPASDGALLNYTGRNGVAVDVRADLAAADLAFRKRNNAAFFRGWFGGNAYFKAYARQSLDQQKELARLRAAGVKTPSAP